jgi:hypothetical protein
MPSQSKGHIAARMITSPEDKFIYLIGIRNCDLPARSVFLIGPRRIATASQLPCNATVLGWRAYPWKYSTSGCLATTRVLHSNDGIRSSTSQYCCAWFPYHRLKTIVAWRRAKKVSVEGCRQSNGSSRVCAFSQWRRQN